MENDNQQPPERNDQYYADLAERLERINEKANSGRGFSHVSYIIADLKRGDIDTAKTECFNQSDKFGNCLDIKDILTKELFEPGEKLPWPLPKD